MARTKIRTRNGRVTFRTSLGAIRSRVDYQSISLTPPVIHDEHKIVADAITYLETVRNMNNTEDSRSLSYRDLYRNLDAIVPKSCFIQVGVHESITEQIDNKRVAANEPLIYLALIRYLKEVVRSPRLAWPGLTNCVTEQAEETISETCYRQGRAGNYRSQ